MNVLAGEMPKVKGRLRDFLEVTLDSEAFDGVQWLDPPNRTRFRIPWSHRSNSHWRPEDGAILKVSRLRTRYHVPVGNHVFYDSPDCPAFL